MTFRTLVAVALGVASLLAAGAAAAGTLIVSDTLTMNPPLYQAHPSYNLPGGGVYDVQVTSAEPLYFNAHWRHFVRKDVVLAPGHPQAGLLINTILDQAGGGYVETISTNYSFSFAIPAQYSDPVSPCNYPPYCPPQYQGAPAIVTYTPVNAFLEFYISGSGVNGPLTAPFEYTITITQRDAAVPEPATWALMLTGFGGAGAMLRRRRSLSAEARRAYIFQTSVTP